jgi:hypothetical protein
VAGVPAEEPAPSLKALRPEAERILRAFSNGRMDAVEDRFVEDLRLRVRAARESFAAQRAELGALVRVEDARLFASRIAGTSVSVVDADVTFEKMPAFAELGFVRQGGQWLLQGFTVAVVDDRPPLPDPGATAAARTLLDDARQRGLVVLFEAIPPAARDKPADEMRAELERPAALLGPLRSYREGELQFAWHRCRTLPAEATFEHGAGTINLTFCPTGGGWRLFQVEVKPVMTPVLFQALVRSAVRDELRMPKADVRCPPGLPAVGETVVCAITNGPKIKVLRSANSHLSMEVVP